ncbi:MAG TPA: prephenate dehydratase [Methanosphaera sp.]|nr:prephenate dehydratase [Methanosphaera sp.]HIJ15102.1 prephenate dehydratase [Methanosphaera sp.]
MQKIKQIGYLGPEGTFSHEAVLNYVNNDSTIIPFDNIIHIFESLEREDIDEAVVPIENSTEGSVLETLDALTYFDLNIINEMELSIRHNLLAQKGTSLDDIVVICSHQQALAQCRQYINKINKEVHAMSSTANAARYVTEISSAAVIGNSILSQKYNLEILDENIQDYDNNVTRFVVISNETHDEITGHDKTSIIISLNGDKPGGLYEILKVFAENNINLTKIESRPSKQGIGKYLFFIDMQGHKNEPHIYKTLTIIESKVSMLKILGSYATINVGGN